MPTPPPLTKIKAKDGQKRGRVIIFVGKWIIVKLIGIISGFLRGIIYNKRLSFRKSPIQENLMETETGEKPIKDTVAHVLEEDDLKLGRLLRGGL